MRMFIIAKKLFPCPVFPDFTIFAPDIPPLPSMYHPYGVLFLRLLCFTTDVPPLQGFHHTAISLFHPPGEAQVVQAFYHPLSSTAPAGQAITPFRGRASDQAGPSETKSQAGQAHPKLSPRPGRHSLILSFYPARTKFRPGRPIRD